MVRQPRPLETKVRFTVRGLLSCTTAAAVLSAAVAPWFRQWNTEQQTAFLMAWANLALGAGVTVVIACVRRLRNERKAGAGGFEVPFSMTRWNAFSSLVGALFWSVFAVTCTFVKAFPPIAAAAAKKPFFDLTVFEQGVFFALAALALWWQTNTVELRDRGLIVAFKFIPWNTVLEYRWGRVDRGMLVLQRRRDSIRLRANLVDKDGIDRFLASRIGGAGVD